MRVQFVIPVLASILILGTLGLTQVFAFTEDTKLITSDAGAFDNFGHFVSISGDTAIVSAQTGDGFTGVVYVFTRSGTTWTEQAKLSASDGAAGDNFGNSVSISGDTAIVGARGNDDAGGSSGSAYVFVRSGTTWTQQAKLIASDASAFDNFGNFVSISGDTAIVASFGDDDACPSNFSCNSGSAYIFVRSGTTWTEQAKLTASDDAFQDFFGNSVSISGDTAIVGSRNFDANTSSGTAYVFVRSGTTWTEQAKLTASGATLLSGFGLFVSISGDTAIVGAASDDDSFTGSAYVFTRSGTTWTEQTKLTASDAVAADFFGDSVFILGDTAIVGAFGDGDAGFQSGSAYVFTRSGTTWTEQAKLIASDDAALDHFGRSFSISGDTVIVGSRNFDTGFNSGAAYVFLLNDDPDSDGLVNLIDNCSNTFNPDQADADNDGIGDVCDNAPTVFNPDQADVDNDGIADVVDNCPNTFNPDQADVDNDGIGDVCDNCPNTFNPDQADVDNDGIGDVCDNELPIANNDSTQAISNISLDVDVLSNDSDADGDPLTIDSVSNPANGIAIMSAGMITYTSNLGFVGDDSFDYTISDGKGGEDTATVTVSVFTDIITTNPSANVDVGPGDVVIVSGGVTVSGNVMNDGGTVTIESGSTIDGNIEIMNGGTVTIDGSTVTGNVDGGDGTISITGGSIVSGNVSSDGSASVVITNTSVDGNIDVKNAQDVSITGNTVLGSLSVSDSSPVTVSGNTVSGNLTIENCTSCTEGNNTVTGITDVLGCVPPVGPTCPPSCPR